MESLRRCIKCLIEKPLSSFSSNGSGLYKARCKFCRSQDESARYAAKTIDEKKVYMRRIAAWVQKNPKRYKEYARKTRRSNPLPYRLKVQLRRRKYRLATPAWANKYKIAEIYKEAAIKGKEVDHIVPLVSHLVCGLHCEANLQLLSVSENRRKSNRRWPDMP